MDKKISPYRVAWNQAEIEKLKAKIRNYRLPHQPTDSGWKYGCDPKFLSELKNYWAAACESSELSLKLNEKFVNLQKPESFYA